MTRRGMTRLDIVAIGVAVTLLAAILTPVLGQLDRIDTLGESFYKLRIIHEGMRCYAGDWNDRQFTAVPDDFGVFGGNCDTYADATGCYPPLFLGWSCFDDPPVLQYAFWNQCPTLGGTSCSSGNVGITIPIRFDPSYTIGSFRMANARPLHEYIAGRFYDPVFYASADDPAYETASPLFGLDCEYVHGGILVPSSYVLSPAAMYAPGVLRAPSQGGFQHPDTLDTGYASPSLAQVAHPALKSWMLEHQWLRNAPAECDPGFQDPLADYGLPCSPFLFNHGAAARPATLFYDGSTATLATSDAVRDDARLLAHSGGVDGLWSRDTPLGAEGYFGAFADDGTITSHHILTTDGILGRDRLMVRPITPAALEPGGER